MYIMLLCKLYFLFSFIVFDHLIVFSEASKNRDVILAYEIFPSIPKEQHNFHEVKDCAITCLGLVISTFGDHLRVELPSCLPVLVDYMGNERTRLTTVKSICCNSRFSAALRDILCPRASSLRIKCIVKEVLCLAAGHEKCSSTVDMLANILKDDSNANVFTAIEWPELIQLAMDVAHFLESRGMIEDALEVATDPDYRFKLAINLGKLEIAKDIATSAQSESKWKQLGELAMSSGLLDMVEELLKQENDLSGLLLLCSSLGDAEGMLNLLFLPKSMGKTMLHSFVSLCWVNWKTVDHLKPQHYPIRDIKFNQLSTSGILGCLREDTFQLFIAKTM
ncbi:hypothetical protein OROHE_010002 [Orobanche hederae]